MDIKTKLISLLMVIFLLCSFGDISIKETAMTEFDWLASESSPKHYSVEIASGNLEVAHGGSTYIPSGVYLNKIKWGGFCASHLSRPDGKLLPEKEAINGKLRYI